MTGEISEAWIYARWSSHEQGSGTSLPRQTEFCRNFGEAKGWSIIDTVVDEGTSAWTGENIRTGKLADLLVELKTSSGKGKAIIVEKLDRLSRQSAINMIHWLTEITSTGVTICTADGRHTISAATLASDQIGVISLVFDSFRGFEESQVKSTRLAAAWAQKRAHGKPMSSRCPAWLKPSGSTSIKDDQTNSCYVVIPDKALTVKRIFDLATKGWGFSRIARNLNSTKTPVLGKGQCWHASYIRKILTNVAVIGEYQPCVKPKGGLRTPVGTVIKDYFPPVVSRDTFFEVNSQRASEIRTQQSGYAPLANLMAGLTECLNCHGSMTYITKGNDILADGRVVKRRYLKCTNHYRGVHKCTNSASWNYDNLEKTVLKEILPHALNHDHLTDSHELKSLRKSLSVALGEITNLKKQQNTLITFVMASDQVATEQYSLLANSILELDSRIIDIQQEIEAKSRKPLHKERKVKFDHLMLLMNSNEEEERYQSRRVIKSALNDIIKSIAFSHSGIISITLMDNIRYMQINNTGEIILSIDLPTKNISESSENYVSNTNEDPEYKRNEIISRDEFDNYNIVT